MLGNHAEPITDTVVNHADGFTITAPESAKRWRARVSLSSPVSGVTDHQTGSDPIGSCRTDGLVTVRRAG
ncbi:hypothetical protein GCM10010442_55720 [Kitasatospora kifunensis]